MIRAFSIADVRSAEQDVAERLEPGELMQRAAFGLAEVSRARLSGAERVVVLAGSGDNGGDALYAAASLAAGGANVLAVLVGKRVHEQALAAAESAGVAALEWRSGTASDDVATALAEADLVLDGIVGIGGTPGLAEHLRPLPDLIGDDAYLIAVDLPSGVDPAGLVSAPCLYADETVTFSLLKPCHLLPVSEPACGLLTVVDIGVPEPSDPVVERLDADDAADLVPVPGGYDDKYSRGVLGVVTGSTTFPGAAVLGATAAVTTGVGMVRFLGPERAANFVLPAVPEVVPADGRVQAWLLGSGWDDDSAKADVVTEALRQNLPMLLDAGALDTLDQPRSGATLLTPHAGELARLASRLDLEGDGVPAAQTVADRLDATVLLKGAVTVIVSPSASGRPIISQSEAPAWLATAGSGDVLAGIIGAFLAAGLEPRNAAALGVIVHGRAARLANPEGPVRALEVAHATGRAVAALLAERLS